MSDLPPTVDVGDFVNHVGYMVNLIGINRVSINSYFDGGGGIAYWSDASETFNVALERVRQLILKMKSISYGAEICSAF